MLINKVKSGHGLVVQWVPWEDNLVDPLSWGVNAEGCQEKLETDIWWVLMARRPE
jgi:hypothetical protein